MKIQNLQGREHVEAKEAFTDALLNLIFRSVSGTGSEGDYVFGEKPSRKFVSGFLLPAMSDTGADDETNDIHISNIGLDFQLHNPPAGDIEISVSFGVYVRVLPTWEEIEQYRLKPLFQLRPAVQKEIRNSIRERIKSLVDQERGKPANLQKSKAELRTIASKLVYEEKGLVITGEKGPLQLDDDELTADKNDITEQDGASTRDILLHENDAILPDDLAQPEEIPQKWRRFYFSSHNCCFRLETSEKELETKLNSFTNELWENISQTISTWLASADGQQWAYRKIPIVPSHIANKVSWNSHLNIIRNQPPDIQSILPNLSRIILVCNRNPNFADPSIMNIRVSFENLNNMPSKTLYTSHDAAIHQVQVRVKLPQNVHSRLKLERIQPSFRFRNFMTYPALGINCGVETEHDEREIILRTTWLPKYILPRITSRKIDGLPSSYHELSDTSTDVNRLSLITQAYESWIDTQENISPADYETDPIKREEEKKDYINVLNAFRRECTFINNGIELLKISQQAHKLDPMSKTAMPFRAWLLLNKTMLRAGLKKGIESWRLFQLAFIIAHIPTISSRIEEFQSWHDPQFDEEMATLLYFPTGGGKSEAFYGLLIFNLFFDRLRGKHRGVSALIRYPLRLLTLQQAQRLFSLLSYAEQVKYENEIGGAPFEIGFWVGRANTPNRNTQEEIKGILKIGDNVPDEGTPERNEYDHTNNAFNKVPQCPYCGESTELRYYPECDNRVGILCFNNGCLWNNMNHGLTPLPFLLTDQDIYAKAPAIILGTIDKLALIGQHDSTINKIIGMFGLARFIDSSGRFYVSRKRAEIESALMNASYSRVAPAFSDGLEMFCDPFPSLIIQDEAHLLEESLGTFAGLFETAFEQLLVEISPLLGERVVRTSNGKPRMAKIVAATATISTPEKQIEALYQRKHLQFPYPGTSLYEGFYSHPEKAPNQDRQDKIAREPDENKERMSELCAPWMRVYASIMTNGRLHTVTTVNVLATYHVTISKLWMLIQNDTRLAVEILKNALSESKIKNHLSSALDELSRNPELLLSLLDLYRISLTYVTNKKGGDQVIDALNGEAPKLHISAGIPINHLKTALISGGIDVKTIQNIMRVAEEAVMPEKLHESLRNIVATSAISHGVDVDKFNVMFFAGTPNDIAEYIQASSRVGRAHSGFSLLVPIPQRRRDRYIVEVHDIFHRFLERMIAPAAIERWADNALKRVVPSFFQTWLIGSEEQRLFCSGEDKLKTTPVNNTHEIKKLIRLLHTDEFYRRAGDFALNAMGVHGRGNNYIGEPNNREYYETFILNEIHRLVTEFNDRSDTLTDLDKFWTGSRVAMKPMTSLRDIDEAGIITAGKYFPERVQKGILKTPRIEDAILIATKHVRTQTAAYSEIDNDGEA